VSGTFLRLHRKGFYFRVRWYGFLVIWLQDRRPTYSLRLQGHHVGPLWFRTLHPDTRYDSREGCLRLREGAGA
jgi:hypothetical protein